MFAFGGFGRFPDERVQKNIFHGLSDFGAESRVDELETFFAEFDRGRTAQTEFFEKNTVEIVVNLFLLERIETLGNERRHKIQRNSQNRLAKSSFAPKRVRKKGENEASCSSKLTFPVPKLPFPGTQNKNRSYLIFPKIRRDCSFWSGSSENGQFGLNLQISAHFWRSWSPEKLNFECGSGTIKKSKICLIWGNLTRPKFSETRESKF